MMDWTDRHCRHFHRLLAPNALLYTEMVTTGAILHGDRDRFLRFDETQHPVALQLGGSDPADLAFCAEAGEQFGYDEINLNCGCPSDRVQSGRFGACLMKEPDHVAACVEAMTKAVKIPVTVKCRIGIDHQDDFAFLDEFVGRIAESNINGGCKTFIIHARKAWLKGLSPKQNREKPPLDYGRVRAVKEKYPQLRIMLNGGITDISTIIQATSSPEWTQSILRRSMTDNSANPEMDPPRIFSENPGDDGWGLDGVMIGREAYQNPWFLCDVERELFHTPSACRETVAIKMHAYAKEQKALYNTPVKSITRHILGLYHEQPGARQWRRSLSTLPYEDGADENVILRALEAMEMKKIAA